MKKFGLYCFLFVLLMSALQGCGGIPREALRSNRMPLEDKREQIRLFDTVDERRILSATEGIFQDLGFRLVESEMDLGLIVGMQDRDAIKAGHILLTAILAGLNDAPATYRQKIRISVVSNPAENNAQKTSVRVTFQRIVWDDYGRILTLEKLNVPALYEGFFKKLSKAVGLEAHKIGFENARNQVEAARRGRITLRHIQSRVLDTTDKVKTLRAVIATLQDLGFVLNEADGALGSIRATKLDFYALRITVHVHPHGETQMNVRANAQYNLTTIEDPEFYEHLFAALEKAMFLTAYNIE